MLAHDDARARKRSPVGVVDLESLGLHPRIGLVQVVDEGPSGREGRLHTGRQVLIGFAGEAASGVERFLRASACDVSAERFVHEAERTHLMTPKISL